MVRFKGIPPYVEFVEFGEKPYPKQPIMDPNQIWLDFEHKWFMEDIRRAEEEFHLTQQRLQHERLTRPVRPEDV